MSLLRAWIYLLSGLAGLYLLVVLFVYLGQRSFLYFPTHDTPPSKLTIWMEHDEVLGCAHEMPQPKAVWLMTHGNGGQAAHRDYVLQRMSPKDALYVLEYPGYGLRSGSPTRESMNRAASEAYRKLRSRYPGIPLNVLGESIGSGPACALAAEPVPPDKIVLVVPFDTLVSVASEHLPYIPVSLLLKDRWDNCAALKNYRGPVDIYGARFDTIIPMKHAEALARSVPQARSGVLNCGHNDWSNSQEVEIQDAQIKLPSRRLNGSFPEDYREAVRAVIAALVADGAKPEEFFAEISTSADNRLEFYLKHQSHPTAGSHSLEEPFSFGDVCGRCRITLFDPATGKVSAFQGIK